MIVVFVCAVLLPLIITCACISMFVKEADRRACLFVCVVLGTLLMWAGIFMLVVGGIAVRIIGGICFASGFVMLLLVNVGFIESSDIDEVVEEGRQAIQQRKQHSPRRWVIAMLFLISATVVVFDFSYRLHSVIPLDMNIFLRLGLAIVSVLLILLILIGTTRLLMSLKVKWPILAILVFILLGFIDVVIGNFLPDSVLLPTLDSTEGAAEGFDPEVGGFITALFMLYYIIITTVFFIIAIFTSWLLPLPLTASPYPLLDRVATSIMYGLCTTIITISFVKAHNHDVPVLGYIINAIKDAKRKRWVKSNKGMKSSTKTT